MIIGPADTDFEDGTFRLVMHFEEQYPNKPPSVKFISQMFHPNVYGTGELCLDILQNRWSPTYDVAAILTSIQRQAYSARQIACMLIGGSAYSTTQTHHPRPTSKPRTCTKTTDGNTRRGYEKLSRRAGMTRLAVLHRITCVTSSCSFLIRRRRCLVSAPFRIVHLAILCFVAWVAFACGRTVYGVWRRSQRLRYTGRRFWIQPRLIVGDHGVSSSCATENSFSRQLCRILQ